LNKIVEEGDRMGSGSQKAIVSLLILVVVISCKDAGENTNISAPVSDITEFRDTNSFTEGNSDNYILDNSASQDIGPVYMHCEKMPEFPGGEAAFNDYLRTSIIYPDPAIAQKAEGRVVVRFIIRSNGQISDAQILRSVRPDMDEECLRVVNEMPVWIPGYINEKAVSVSYSITIRFLLNNSENLNGIYILPQKNRQ
jgi:protein TonB